MKLVPLAVRIGLKSEGGHDYPPFNEIPESVRENMDWARYIDRFGGWHYDKHCGHVDHDPAGQGEHPDVDSPAGTWLGFFLVPKAFADEAVSRWPAQCSIMTEADCGSFYERRCTCHQPEVREDAVVLQAIAAKRSMGIAETPADRNALDENHPMPGRVKNKTKTWAGLKAQRGIEIE